MSARPPQWRRLRRRLEADAARRLQVQRLRHELQASEQIRERQKAFIEQTLRIDMSQDFTRPHIVRACVNVDMSVVEFTPDERGFWKGVSDTLINHFLYGPKP